LALISLDQLKGTLSDRFPTARDFHVGPARYTAAPTVKLGDRDGGEPGGSDWGDRMPNYFGASTLVLMIGIVLTRTLLLRQQGVEAMKFGQIDRTDFFIPPFALFYFYIVFAAAFGWPTVGGPEFLHSEVIAWVGVLFCLTGLLLLSWSIVSFGRSFRVGIDNDRPDELITNGTFAFSRNPIYVAFAVILIGEFLILPNWITLIYVLAATWLFHRQVLREEDYLRGHYGQAFIDYCSRVRRYV
jgi:protein-S-isoprenylcysteine O-methyltransferase Ste14